MGAIDLPRTGIVIAANLQHFSGKPWTPVALLTFPQQEQRTMPEPRGSRRLSSQTLSDVRLSRPIRAGVVGRIELLLDVLNMLNDSAEESLVNETLTTVSSLNPTVGQPASFVDPRRAMLGVRIHLGR